MSSEWSKQEGKNIIVLIPKGETKQKRKEEGNSPQWTSGSEYEVHRSGRGRARPQVEDSAIRPVHFHSLPQSHTGIRVAIRSSDSAPVEGFISSVSQKLQRFLAPAEIA